MTIYQELFAIGECFDAFVSNGLPAEITAVKTVQDRLNSAGTISAATLHRLQSVERRYHLLVAGEMWCPDCQLNVTALNHLQHLQPHIDIAIISKARAEHALRERLGLERILIPLVAVLDEQFEPIGHFVERPQDVIAGGEAVKAGYRAGQYLDSTLSDLLTLIETHESRNR